MADDERGRWQRPSSDPPSYGVAGLPAPPPASSAFGSPPEPAAPARARPIDTEHARNYAPTDPGAPRQRVDAAPAQPASGAAVGSLTLSIIGLGVLVFTLGFFSFVSVPCSVLGWVLGRRAQRRDGEQGVAQAGVVTGIIGTVLGAVALLGWLAIIAA